MRSRPYRAGDLPRMLGFLTGRRAADPAGDYEHVGDLQWRMRLLSEPERCLRLWDDGRTLVGYAARDGGALVVQVDRARAEAGTLAEEMLDWALAAAPGEPAEAYAHEGDAGRIGLLERLGFARDDLWFVELWRRLDEPLPGPEVPPGFVVRAFAGAPEVEAYVAMHRDAWSDRRPSSYTVEAHRRVMAMPGYERELNPVVVAPDGVLAASCVCWLDRRTRTAEIEPLGTRPAFRRRGLGRALVLEALRRMRAHGATRALVYGVSGNEPARRLYLSTGFVPERRVLVYRRISP